MSMSKFIQIFNIQSQLVKTHCPCPLYSVIEMWWSHCNLKSKQVSLIALCIFTYPEVKHDWCMQAQAEAIRTFYKKKKNELCVHNANSSNEQVIIKIQI